MFCFTTQCNQILKHFRSVVRGFVRIAYWALFSLLGVNPIPTGLGHVTFIYGLISPMAGRNRVKEIRWVLETPTFIVLISTCVSSTFFSNFTTFFFSFLSSLDFTNVIFDIKSRSTMKHGTIFGFHILNDLYLICESVIHSLLKAGNTSNNWFSEVIKHIFMHRLWMHDV